MSADFDLNQISFHQLVETTRPSTVNAPDQSSDNLSLTDPGSQVAQYIDVTAEVLSRFYGGLYVINQSYKDVMHLPETIGLMTIAIKENLLRPLATQFPEFADFEFELTDRGTIIGLNDTANTILNAIQQIAQAPVDSHENGTPEHRQVSDEMAYLTARDLEDDCDEDEWGF